jgi:YbbR domain-containing protein
MLRLLTDHWELKVIALAVACTLWFFVATSEQGQVALATPVEYVGLSEGLVLVAGQRESVEVEVRAVRSVVARLGPETLRVRIDLAAIEAGETAVQLTPAHVQAPPGATVTRINPAQLFLTAAAAETTAVSIVPQVKGVPAPGYAVQKVVVEPPSVRIKGPRSTIEGRGEVSTLPIDVSGSRRSVTQSVGLMLPASTYMTRERTVQVTVEIAEEAMSQQHPTPPQQSATGKKGAGR